MMIEEFENAIRGFGIKEACAYFGHASDSQFTKTLEEQLNQPIGSNEEESE